MSNTLKLLHPFMPFITEEIWQTLPHEGEAILVSPWPVYNPSLAFSAEEAQMERIMRAIRAVRNRRSEMNVPPSKKAHVYIETADEATFRGAAEFFQRLAYASEVTVGSTFEIPGAVLIVADSARLYIPMGELVDLEAEKARLTKELENTQKQLAGVQAKLHNEQFTSKAPAHIVQNQRDAAAKLEEKIQMLEQSLAEMAG